ncbi:MAG TPA: MFS transporter [Rhodanobacteraceae bacterium]|nr:MFS transporter [Rhodanobacteraceae bacterium]
MQGSARRPMWIAAAAIGLIYVGSTLLTPLYPIYRREFHFSELIVTAIYAVYVVGNLAVLFFFGRLSDQIGRRAATLIALGITCVSVLLFLFAGSVAWLFPARILNGFAAGLGAGALTAWIAELEPRGDRMRAAVVASAANLGGLALGALLAGALAQFAPWPLRLPWIAFLVLLIAMFAALYAVKETVPQPVRTTAELELKPRIGVPRDLRLAFVAPAAIAFAAFALGGFYAALAPELLTRSLHRGAPLIVGGIVALFFACGAATAVLGQRLRGRHAMVAALILLWIGLGLLTLAEALHSMTLLVLASIVTGAAMALGYRGSLQIVNEIAPEQQRAELVSSYLLVCYSANALPVIGVGVLSLPLGPENAHRVFAIVLVALASLACAIGLRYAPQEKPANASD